MKKITLFLALMIFLSISLLAQNSFAIGTWDKGFVTKAPWSDQYVFIEIDHVKFTIMKNAKIVNVYQKKGATYKDRMNIYSISKGHTVTYQKEGNRIYQIEKIR